jgi:pheromone shutdown protein TraB
MKLVAIMQRGEFKDYVDLYYLFKDIKITLKDIISLLEKKYKIKINEKILLDALVYVEDLNENSVEFIKDKISKDQIYKFFKKLVKNYYENY